MPILHFSSRFTVADWRKNTTVKHDTFEEWADGVGGYGFFALLTGRKHSPSPCDWRAGWVVVGWLVGWLAGWLVGWLVGMVGWLVWYGLGNWFRLYIA